MKILISPSSKDIGFPIKRLLPSRFKQRVGPFIFFDHMGPAKFQVGTTAGDVRPHPHIGLATVTYLLEGAMMHRDSLGTVQRIEAGAVNLMTAGNGIVHSERIPTDIRDSATALQGIQTWLALPTEYENVEANFQHYAASEIPQYRTDEFTANILIGEAFGVKSPVETLSITTYINLHLKAKASYQHVSLRQELAVYALSGNAVVNGEALAEHHLIILDEGEDFTITAADDNCNLLILGGAPLAGDRYISWNFVSSSKEKLREAGERWEAQEFGKVPGETEWIPLPPVL